MCREEAEAFRDSLDPAWPFPAGLSFCLPPLSSRALHPVLLRQFLVYHWRTGADAFVLYDAGALGEDARGLLAAEVQRGVVDVVDFWEIRKYNIYNYGEVACCFLLLGPFGCASLTFWGSALLLSDTCCPKLYCRYQVVSPCYPVHPVDVLLG